MLNRAKAPERKEGRDVMVIRTEYPYQTLQFWPAGAESPALDLWNCYVPVDREQRVNHTYGLMMIKRPPRAPWILDLVWPVIVWFTEGIFREDREIVELEQAAFDAQGEDWNNEIFAVIRGLKAVLTGNGTRLGTPSGAAPRPRAPCGSGASRCGAAYGQGRG
jgi:phenylpropionate dioxygenase-like ring-hydroxylating dioxygenase large terminal subunit